jgi:hypothetical protein
MVYTDWLWNLLGAMAVLDDVRRAQLREKFSKTTGGVRKLVLSQESIPFLRGLARTHNVPDDKVPKLALGVLYVALGEWPLSNLAAGLSSTMGIPNDVAQKVAAEIEKELFAPIMLEFNKFLEKQRQPKAEEKAKQAGATNVIDLKNKPPQTRPSRPVLPKPGEFTK